MQRYVIALLAVALAGCESPHEPSVQVRATQSIYDFADGCFLLKADDRYVKSSGTGFTTAGVTAADAERFYMKATGLGRYLFYTVGQKLLSGNGTAVTAAAAASNGADWTLSMPAANVFAAATLDRYLAVGATGALVQGTTPARLAFEGAGGCTTYPEMPVGIATTYVGPGAGRLFGFADVHAHMAMGSDMSDGSGDRGPSAGGVMYGHAVNRFGVVEAVKDCSAMHGRNGATTAEIVLDSHPDGRHDTVGWPTFVSWPAPESLLHQQMYWKWVERTYRAGLRLMVLHGTNIEALCDVAKKSAGSKVADCTDMGVGMKQVAYAHDMQDYIDAQYGGPGKGWFRIVKDPDEAEAVIRAGKMAVVPGLEFSNIFRCNVTYLDGGQEIVGCDKKMIDDQIDEAWDAGVRGVFLYHDVDSALGGTGIFNGLALNLVNFYGTRKYWQTYTCDDEWGQEEDQGYFYGAGAVMANPFDVMIDGAESHDDAPPEFAAFLRMLKAAVGDPAFTALAGPADGRYPVYPPGEQCNARGTTELGRYALEAVMRKGFVLDIDHAEISIKQDMLDVGAQTDPAYPMVSAHGGHGGITNAQALQMLQQGGIIYPGMVNGREYLGFHDKVETIWAQMTPAARARYPLAVGYGADQNGLANQPLPRKGDDVAPVDYESLTLFEGPGWGPDFAAAGIAPIRVGQLAIDGGRIWNVDEDGVAHYGLIPDVVEQIRLESAGNTKYLDSFYRSADAYVRLWKQTRAAAAKRPEPAAPVNPPRFVPHPLDPTTGETPTP